MASLILASVSNRKGRNRQDELNLRGSAIKRICRELRKIEHPLLHAIPSLEAGDLQSIVALYQ